MTYSREAHDLIEQAFQELKTKKSNGVAYAYMLGLLMPNVSLTNAKRIAKMISEMEVEND